MTRVRAALAGHFASFEGKEEFQSADLILIGAGSIADLGAHSHPCLHASFELRTLGLYRH
jgi:hypothetical protein